MDFIFRIIEKYSSKLNVWAWNKRWKNRQQGTGYDRQN